MVFGEVDHNAQIGDPYLRGENRVYYANVSDDFPVTCATHQFGIKDKDGETMFLEIIEYLKSDNVPTHCDTDLKHKAFIRKTKQFFFYEERLWKIKRE
ncbi:hypothetical protein H0H87_000882, partial [Tephrocybe sp. NHM501043]